MIINNTLINCNFYTFTKLPYKWKILSLHLREHIYTCSMRNIKPTYGLFKNKFTYKLTLLLKNEKNQKNRDNFITLWRNWSPIIREAYQAVSSH